MPNYKLTIEYDGTHFWGWQYQPNRRTVQGEVERALGILFKEPVRVNTAGRTDRGVHALGQVANFTHATSFDQERMRMALNGITDDDLTVHSVELMHDTFHARFDATARQYVYHVNFQPAAIGRQYSYFFPHQVDYSAMQEAGNVLRGEHVFSAFAHKSKEEKHYKCCVDMVAWQFDTNRMAFRIRANRFLHGMVRRLIGTLLQVGTGKLSPQAFREILESGDRNHVGFKAPPHGLFLERVYYDTSEEDIR